MSRGRTPIVVAVSTGILALAVRPAARILASATVLAALISAWAPGCGQSAGPPPPPRTLELVDAAAAAELAPVIAAEGVRAQQAGRTLVVYEGASWCEPCVQFHAAAAAGRLDAAFGDLRLLVFDADRDGEALQRAGYVSQLIPLFAIPRADGRSSGKQIEGAHKGADAVDQIGPRLRALVDGRL